MKQKYDTPHQCHTINNWKKYGVISDNYYDLYKHHMSINNCELCNIVFDNTFKNQRCLDHNHKTGLYRKTLCRSCNSQYIKADQKLKCNNKSRHMWICNHKTKNKSGNYSFTWRYERKMSDIKVRKCFKTLTQAIAFSFIHILKKPLS